MSDRGRQALFARITGSQRDDWTKPSEGLAGLLHICALTLSKLSDGLINPKLVLSWLLNALGAPAYLVGALVPVREAGALLPQVFLAPFVARMKMKRWAWVAGAAGQGVAALLIALAALWLSGGAAGWVVLALLAFLAVCRAACSVSYKDILGKTVGQTRRGAVTGLAGSLASVGVFIFALLMVTGVLETQAAVIAAVGLAGALWLGAACVLSLLPEEQGDAEESGKGNVLQILRQDGNLRRFIAVRGLLVSTALAPPYLVILAGDGEGNGLGQLGALVLASSAASFMSSYIWGRLADASGRVTLSLAGLAGALALGAAAVAGATGMAQNPYVIPAILFLLMIAYHGVRQARSTYLVDISPEEARAGYAAAANTAIGSILLLAGLFGGALSFVGPYGAILGYAAMSAAGGLYALRLEEA